MILIRTLRKIGDTILAPPIKMDVAKCDIQLLNKK